MHAVSIPALQPQRFALNLLSKIHWFCSWAAVLYIRCLACALFWMHTLVQSSFTFLYWLKHVRLTLNVMYNSFSSERVTQVFKLESVVVAGAQARSTLCAINEWAARFRMSGRGIYITLPINTLRNVQFFLFRCKLFAHQIMTVPLYFEVFPN